MQASATILRRSAGVQSALGLFGNAFVVSIADTQIISAGSGSVLTFRHSYFIPFEMLAECVNVRTDPEPAKPAACCRYVRIQFVWYFESGF
jgi:hypothetical protein